MNFQIKPVYLAEKIKNTPDKFGEIFHLYKAEEYKKIIEISTQNYFKKQIDAFCPPNNVLNDIQFSISAAGKQKNINHIFNLTLSGAVVNLMESYLFEEEIDKLINLFLSLDKYELAKNYVRKRRTLLISKEKAMSLVRSFLDFKHNEEAKLLFELSEPLDFCHIEQTDLFDKRDTLKAWASNAPYFYPIDRICFMISSVKVKREHPFNNIENDLKAALLYNAGQTLIDKDDLNSLEDVFTHLKNLNQEYYYFCLLLDLCKCLIKKKNDKKKAEKYFKKAEELRAKNNNFSLLFSEVCFFSFENKNQAKKIIKRIKYPENYVTSEKPDDISPYIYRFKLIRLMTALHIPVSLETLIPDPEEERKRGLVILERNFGRLGVLWGNFLSGKRISPETLKNELLPFIRFYNRDFFSPTDWTNSYGISQSKDAFFNILISFVKSSYPQELTDIFNLFKSQWDKEENKHYWNTEIKQKIILYFFNAGGPKSELNNELEKFQTNMSDNMDEIVKDRFDYANLLIKFNKKEEAERALKDLIQKSINIGRRKDSQLITWLDWLALFNKEKPEGAKKRIEQFIRYVHIAETTTERSGGHFAFGDLIHVAAEISSSYALALSKWLVDNGCISFSRYIDCLTSALLKTGCISIDEGFSIIKHILLPVSNDRDISSLESAIRQLQGSPKNEIKEKVLDLIEYINCQSIPSNQNNQRRDVVFTLDKINFNWLKLGIKWDDVKDAYSSSDSYEIKINKQTVNFFEMKNKIKSISDLLKFKKTSSGSFYEWNRLIDSKKHLISPDDLPALEKEFKQTSWNDILHILSDHFYKAGEKEISLKLAEDLLKNSHPHEWIWFSEKTRVKAFKSLKNHRQPDDFKNELIYTLTKDLRKFDHSYLAIAQEFDQIFNLIYDKIPIEDVWPFVDEFLKRLFSSCNETNFPLPDINEAKSNLPAVFQILLPLLLHPVNLISQGAYSAMYNLLHKINDCSLMEEIINISNEEQQILLLNMLKGVIFYDSSKKYLVTEKVLKRISSDNFYIRVLVQDLLKELNHSYHPVYIEKKSKPSKNLLYELTLPEPKESRLYGIEKYDAYRALPNTNNPLETVKLYKEHISNLSRLSGVPLINLAARTVQIMDKLSGGSYGYESEEKIRSTLRAQNLRMAFIRPRSKTARRAVCHLISELLNLKKINEESALMIMNDLSYIDPLLTCIKWFPKPDLIQYDFPKYTVSDKWIDEAITENQLMVGKAIESMAVVGEMRHVKSGSFPYPSEKIQSVLSFSKQPIQLNGKRLYKEYFNLSDALDILYLNEGFTFDTEKSNWPAIHPALMKKYGMELSKYSPFVWLSNKKETMSKIIYWKNGSVEHNPSYIGQCGNGVLCLLNKKLLDKILLENTVYLKTKRTRTYLKDNKEKTVTLCKPFYNA